MLQRILSPQYCCSIKWIIIKRTHTEHQISIFFGADVAGKYLNDQIIPITSWLEAIGTRLGWTLTDKMPSEYCDVNYSMAATNLFVKVLHRYEISMSSELPILRLREKGKKEIYKWRYNLKLCSSQQRRALWSSIALGRESFSITYLQKFSHETIKSHKPKDSCFLFSMKYLKIDSVKA